ncbi:MAG TPA: hypothetical protein VGS19_27990 [Streptosporangiaceae bacterium]|nr:hypothetical protein [Streptosporangiaceae bacterium]
MTPHDVFIAATDPAAEVREVIATALGAAFEPSRDVEPVPVLAVGPTQVFFHDSHPFEDDVDLPVSRYRYWVSVQDTGRDEDRQLAIAQRVFDAIKETGRPVLLSYGLQVTIATHP